MQNQSGLVRPEIARCETHGPTTLSAWSMCKNCGLCAIVFWRARPSAGMGVADAQKNLGLFAIPRCADEPFPGIGVADVQKLRTFCDFSGATEENMFFFCISSLLVIS